MTSLRRLCVFCGSSKGSHELYAESAARFGAALAAAGVGLVYGGGHIGLMGVLADAVLAGGAEVIGVIPRAMVAKELAHAGLSQLHVVDTMHQRKALMADLADGFAALPGGYGTADELFEILTWGQLGLHAKPIGLLNVGGFFDPLLAWVGRAVADGFLRAEHRDMLRVAPEPLGLLQLLLRHQPPASLPKWIEAAER
jgi:uncharacterized protein (TIGR00730 family)